MKNVFKPILFSTPMVQAILNGEKTQTRRIVKTKFSNTNIRVKELHSGQTLILVELQNDIPKPRKNENGSTTHRVKAFKECVCPYDVDDILWVRETFALKHTDSNGKFYRADNAPMSKFIKWTPSIFMPKSACRLFLKVKSTRWEMLNEISESDAIAEGCSKYGPFGEYRGSIHPNGGVMKYRAYSKASRAFQCIWESINGNGSWNKITFVWVIEFEQIDKPEDFLTT